MSRFHSQIDIISGAQVQVPYSEEEEAAADAYIAPTQSQVDDSVLSSKLSAPGTVEGAMLKAMFAMENRIRALESQPALTLNQFKAQIKSLMRNGS